MFFPKLALRTIVAKIFARKRRGQVRGRFLHGAVDRFRIARPFPDRPPASPALYGPIATA